MNDMFVTKRSGTREIYDRGKAIMSVCDAWEAVYDEKPDYLVIDIVNKVESQLEELYNSGAAIDTDTINDLIEKEIESIIIGKPKKGLCPDEWLDTECFIIKFK